MVTCATDGAFRRATHYSTPTGSYTPFRMELMHYSREWKRRYAACDLFHPERPQHSWFGPSWPWYCGISWVRSSHTFKRSHSPHVRARRVAWANVTLKLIVP